MSTGSLNVGDETAATDRPAADLAGASVGVPVCAEPSGALRREAGGTTEPRYALAGQVLLEREDGSDDIVVIDGRTGAIYASNAAASLLLQELDKGAGAADLVALLGARFGVAEEDGREDVRVFLEQLSAMGLIDLA